jgi:uncharacterized membrane protein
MNWPLVSWEFWAVLSAAFAALTAIFAKIGVENVNSDFATFIRRCRSMGFVPESQVRDGLAGGGRWIRTLGPPSAATPLSDR